MNWFRMWADLFVLFRSVPGRQTKDSFQPYSRPICWMIMPAHEDWWWVFRKDHNPGNDNATST